MTNGRRFSVRFKFVFLVVAICLLSIPMLTVASSELAQESALQSPLQGVLASQGEDSDFSEEATVSASAVPAATGEYIGIAPTAAAVADLTKVLRTPADEPTPNLTFRFNAVRHSFNGNTGAAGQVPQLGTVIDGVGTFDLNINATNGSPSTAGGITTLTRAINILEGVNFGLPLPAGVYVWHVYEVAESSGINALDGRSAVQYSPAIYALTVSVTGTTAATRAAAVTFAAVENDLFAPVGAPMYAWGENTNGRLGLGDTANRNRPTRVPDAENWVRLSTAVGLAAAINAEGHLYVWGNARNSAVMGRGGTGGTANIMTPERLFIPGEVPANPATHHNWVKVETSGHFAFALNDQGELFSWGANATGQLGHGNTATINVPTRVPGNQVWAYVSTSSYANLAAERSFTMAVTEDGYLYTWGANNHGHLARGTANATRLTSPGRATAGNAESITWRMARTGGAGVAFGICVDGYLYSWGNNSGSRLGRPGTASANLAPARVDTSETNWVDVLVMINAHTMIALTEDGRIFSWSEGTGRPDALGRPGGGAGSATQTNRPRQIGTASDWVYIGGGNNHAIAITRDGRLYAWGNNGSGRLGDGTTTSRNVPVFILQTFGLEGISQSGSGTHSMALIRTDPMTFTNVYSVEHPDPITVQADITKALRELTRTPQQANSPLSFNFAIQRYSFNGSTAAAQVANLPGLGFTPFAGGVYTLPVAMNHASVTAIHSGGVTTLVRDVNILTDAQFSNPGVYVWRVSEAAGSSGVTTPAHMNYSPAVYYLTVTVTETGTAGNTTLTGAVTVTVGTADVPPAAVNTMVFTNTHSVTSTLRISKTATGEMLPAGQQFPFTIAITGSVLCPATSTYTARLYTAAEGGGASTFVREEVFENAIGRTINVLNNQYFVFNTIAEGATFSVAEAVPDNFSGSVAIVVGGQTVTPAVPGVGVDDVNRNLSTGNRIIGAGVNSAAFTNVHHWQIPTGLTVGADGTWIILAIATATLLGAAVATKSALQGAAPVAPTAVNTAFVGQSAQYVSNVGKAAFRRAESIILRALGK